MRDFTTAEFHAALERNGFDKPVLFWVSSKDNPSTSYGMIVNRRTGKVARRSTVAHVIKWREEDREKARKKAAEPPLPPITEEDKAFLKELNQELHKTLIRATRR
jgi:hypothetical protein